MKKILLTLLAAIFSFYFIGCQKNNDLPSHTAKGKIIAITSGCNLDYVIIELESPKALGSKGYYCQYPAKEQYIECFEYKNAIGVPYFSKTGLPVEKQKVGTTLTFVYRELNENEDTLFMPEKNLICLAIYGPPNIKNLIITKIFD